MKIADLGIFHVIYYVKPLLFGAICVWRGLAVGQGEPHTTVPLHGARFHYYYYYYYYYTIIYS